MSYPGMFPCATLISPAKTSPTYGTRQDLPRHRCFRASIRPVFAKRAQRKIGLICADGNKSVGPEHCQTSALVVFSGFDVFEDIVDPIQRRLWPRWKLRGGVSPAADRS